MGACGDDLGWEWALVCARSAGGIEGVGGGGVQEFGVCGGGALGADG